MDRIDALTLRLAIENAIYGMEIEDGNEIIIVKSFSEEGLLTYDEGLVLTINNGQKFQLTIKQAG